MHPLVADAISSAGLSVQCDAEPEPALSGLRRALLEKPPVSNDVAQLAELLQTTLQLTQAVQAALLRTLEWARSARRSVKDGQSPKAALRATLAEELTLFIDSPDHEPLVWPHPGSPLNTLLILRADEFTASTHRVAVDEHWAIEQARFQACGVLSRALSQMVAALRTVLDVELLEWPVYRRDGKALNLQLSHRLTRAGLQLRQQVAQAYDELDAARAALDHALAAVGLTGLSQWQAMLPADLGGDADTLRLVRSHGAPRASRGQASALAAAHQRFMAATAAVEEGDAATRELRLMSRARTT